MRTNINRDLRISARNIAAAAIALMTTSAHAQFSLTGTTYTQDFNLLTAAGTTTTTIPGWFVGTGTGAIAGTTVVAASGGSNAGGNYNFGIAGVNSTDDRSLGSLASSSTQRNTEFRFTNDTGQSITALTILYDGEQWRVGGTGAVENQLVLQFSLDGSTFTPLGAAFNFSTPIDAGTTSALDGNAAANRVADIGGVYTLGAEITVGQTAFLRWADVDNSSNDHAMAVDNFRLTATLIAAARTLTWTPTTGDWDLLTANWNDGAAPATFQSDDIVVFGDSGLTQSTVTIAPLTVAPRNVRVTNTTSQYTFIGGAISGSSSLTKTGAGRLVLASANTYSGATTVTEGTLSISADTQLGAPTAPLALGSAGVLETTGSLTLNANRAVSGAGKIDIAQSTTLAVEGAVNLGAVTLSNTGSLAFNGLNSVQISSLTLEKAMLILGTQTIQLSGPITTTYAAGTATISAAINFGATTSSSNRFVTVADGAAATDLILSGALSMTGTGRLTKLGDGTLELTGTSNYSGLRIGTAGTLPVNGGRVIIHDADDLGFNQLQFNAGMLVNPDAAFTTPVGLSVGAGQFPEGAVFEGNPITFLGSSGLFIAASSTYRHKITANTNIVLAGGLNASTNGGSGATLGSSEGLTITGSGTVFLPAAANDLQENITVDAGSLEISGALTGTTVPSVTATNNGLLTGSSSGAAGIGNTIIASTGRLAPGTSADATGTLLIGGSLDIQTGGTFTLDIEGNSSGLFDQLSVSGIVKLGGTLNLSLLAGYTPGATDYLIVIANDAADPVDGTFAGLPEGALVGTTAYYINYAGGDGNDVALTTIPEPGSSALLLGGLALLGFRRKRTT